MKIVAAVFADFDQAPLGTPSQLLTQLGGRTILAHALRRLMRVEGLASRALVVAPASRDVAAAALADAGLSDEIDLLAVDDVPRPRRELVRATRAWNMYAWRGGPMSNTWFDEYVEPRAAARVVDHCHADAALCLCGHQPALDPAIASEMIRQQIARANEAQLLFTQAPPGLAGVILRRDPLLELQQRDLPVAIPFVYRPEMPHADLINRDPCLQLDDEIVQTPARLTGETRRSREILAAAFDDLGEDVDALRLCRWLRDGGGDWAGELPIEVELELTTADPLPETTLRPRGQRVPERTLTDLAAVQRLAEELGRYDDRLVVLGGCGDPLKHPEFGRICQTLRAGGAAGLAVLTPLVELSEAHEEALFETPVDLVLIQLDADSREQYARLHGRDAYDEVIARFERLQRRRQEQSRPRPLLSASLTRSAGTLEEMEAFYDRWIRVASWAVIEGYNDFGGLLTPDPLMSTTPPVREPCRRLERRMLLLADGRAAQCGQDVRGSAALGDWRTQRLCDLWRGVELEKLRAAHQRLEFSDYLLCKTCQQWSRP